MRAKSKGIITVGVLGLAVATAAAYTRVHADLVHFRLAEWLERLGQEAVVAEHLARSVELGLSHPQRLQEAALELLQRDQPEPAFAAAQRLREAGALDAADRSALAGHLDRLGQPERARALYEGAGALTAAETLHYASLEERSGEPERALELYRTLLERLEAEGAEAAAPLRASAGSEPRASVGGESLAPPPITAPPSPAAPPARAADDDEIQARLELARLLADRERLDEAIREYRRILDSEPDHLAARLGLARTLFWAGRTAEAASAAEGIDTDRLEPEERLFIADLHLSSGSHERAIGLYADHLSEQPDHHEARHRKALALAWSERYAEAIEQFDRLVEARPDDRQLLRQFAQVLTWAEQPDRAIEMLERSLED